MKEGRQGEKGKGRVEEIIKRGRVGRREERVESVWWLDKVGQEKRQETRGRVGRRKEGKWKGGTEKRKIGEEGRNW